MPEKYRLHVFRVLPPIHHLSVTPIWALTPPKPWAPFSSNYNEYHHTDTMSHSPSIWLDVHAPVVDAPTASPCSNLATSCVDATGKDLYA